MAPSSFFLPLEVPDFQYLPRARKTNSGWTHYRPNGEEDGGGLLAAEMFRYPSTKNVPQKGMRRGAAFVDIECGQEGILCCFGAEKVQTHLLRSFNFGFYMGLRAQFHLQVYVYYKLFHFDYKLFHQPSTGIVTRRNSENVV